jgi:hypothetical protein
MRAEVFSYLLYFPQSQLVPRNILKVKEAMATASITSIADVMNQIDRRSVTLVKKKPQVVKISHVACPIVTASVLGNPIVF